jgi:hypothetical protein
LAALLIKPKQQHEKNQNKNTGLFINCMDFVVVRTKINKNERRSHQDLIDGFFGNSKLLFITFHIKKTCYKNFRKFWKLRTKSKESRIPYFLYFRMMNIDA